MRETPPRVMDPGLRLNWLFRPCPRLLDLVSKVRSPTAPKICCDRGSVPQHLNQPGDPTVAARQHTIASTKQLELHLSRPHAENIPPPNRGVSFLLKHHSMLNVTRSDPDKGLVLEHWYFSPPSWTSEGSGKKMHWSLFFFSSFLVVLELIQIEFRFCAWWKASLYVSEKAVASNPTSLEKLIPRE